MHELIGPSATERWLYWKYSSREQVQCLKSTTFISSKVSNSFPVELRWSTTLKEVKNAVRLQDCLFIDIVWFFFIFLGILVCTARGVISLINTIEIKFPTYLSQLFISSGSREGGSWWLTSPHGKSSVVLVRFLFIPWGWAIAFQLLTISNLFYHHTPRIIGFASLLLKKDNWPVWNIETFLDLF